MTRVVVRQSWEESERGWGFSPTTIRFTSLSPTETSSSEPIGIACLGKFLTSMNGRLAKPSLSKLTKKRLIWFTLVRTAFVGTSKQIPALIQSGYVCVKKLTLALFKAVETF